MKFLIALGFSLAAAPLAAAPPSIAEQRAAWERGQAAQHAFRHRRIVEAGFAPIAEAEVEGRQLRRLLPSDPYMILPMPGIELERHSNGAVTLRVQHRGWSTQPVPVDRAAWDALASAEAAAFASPSFRPARADAAPPSSPPPICHGWSVILEADHRRTASWWECSGEPVSARDYAMRMIETAMASRPACAFDRASPFWSFNACFAPPARLDDPALDAELAALRKDYDEAPGSDRLGEARKALRAPGLALGNPAWLAARDAIARFRGVQDLRRERLRRLQALAARATRASDADRARIGQTIAQWRDFLDGQDRNYADLLQRLAWPAGGAG